LKLLSKTNRYYFIYTVLLLLVGGVTFYYVMSYVIRDQVKETLENELAYFEKQAQDDEKLLKPTQDLEFSLSRSNRSNVVADEVKDTLIQEVDEDEMAPFLQLTAYRNIHDKSYTIVVRESLIESDEILFGTSITMIVLLALILLGMLLINNYLSGKLWKPFYTTLNKLKQFNLNGQDDIALKHSGIEEFDELNAVLSKMTEKIKKDYKSLKQFSENASHEIQTPIAIIKSHVDRLMQSVKEEKALQDVHKIEQASNRISKINQALLLLTRIENRQFSLMENVDINTITKQCLEDFDELIKARDLKVSLHAEDATTIIKANQSLIQVMISNLINNAIKHNIPDGSINILIQNQQMMFENTGKPLVSDPTQLFERFAKADQSADSTGLGLSIIKQICEVTGFDITYIHSGNMHQMIIKFNQSLTG